MKTTKIALLVVGAIVGAKVRRYYKSKKYIEELNQFVDESMIACKSQLEQTVKTLQSQLKGL